MLAGIDAASRAGFAPLKIDTVVIRGANDDELVDLIEFGKARQRRSAVHRVHGRRRRDALVAGRGRLARARSSRGCRGDLRRHRAAAGRDRRRRPSASGLPDGTTFGIIASTTEPFCAACDRSRLTADGLWLLCLYARGGLDLRRPLREGATREELAQLISTVWSMRADRGAEERLGSPAREVLIPVAALKRDAHLEMHTRGG